MLDVKYEGLGGTGLVTTPLNMAPNLSECNVSHGGIAQWFGHCLRLEPNHICVKSLSLEVSGTRNRGRPKKRWRDNIKGDMKKYLTEDMTQDRKYWMTQIMYKEMVKKCEKGKIN